jgi:mRNA-degrading endonuclease toxin of MazEF toxin-antitoxin module
MISSAAATKQIRRGEIWWASLPNDPPGKGPRPVIIVSRNSRNQHPRAVTVLAVPLSTSIHKPSPVHVLFQPGETGLPEACVAQAENVTVVSKDWLVKLNMPSRLVSSTKICQLAGLVAAAMDCDSPR